jgi:hypothetical protein
MIIIFYVKEASMNNKDTVTVNLKKGLKKRVIQYAAKRTISEDRDHAMTITEVIEMGLERLLKEDKK